MTLMERIYRAGQGVEPGWDDRDVDRVWQGLKRKRRRRAIAAGAGVAGLAVAGLTAWVLFVAPGRNVVVSPVGRPTPPSQRDEQMRFADGSTATRLGGREASLTVVEDAPARVVVALAKGGARFEVTPRRDRVFSVRAGDVTISVLGTAFSVERVADRVGVAVTRGVVRVDWGVGARQLAAGEEGWFPPLLVSPSTDEGRADTEEKQARSVRPLRRTPPGDATQAPAPVEPTAPAPAPAIEHHVTPAAVSRATDAATLMADADRARLAGRFEDGAALLQRLVREHPGDPRAPLAAFSLGRLLLGELGRPADAAQAFARARSLAPDGPLAQEALAREAEAWTRAGDLDRARACESEYRARTQPQSGHRP